ncbi:MAG: glycoside hydrolase family 2 [Hungatella sp.]|jgi:beta-galactosidase/beta-glucuronidase|nr:glycoside hydrolase family 2 [Hungatella sp.]
MNKRSEYPRPDFVRSQWMSLNGTWDFYIKEEKRTIEVPFVCQSLLSGIGEKIKEDEVVYERTFQIPAEWKGKDILLNFGAVDYSCRVFINGRMVGEHVGGQSSFSYNITEALNWGKEAVRVEVTDPLSDEKIARGKQFWEETSKFIWYTPSTGIWQSVWLEPVEKTRFRWIHFTPDVDEGMVRIDYCLDEKASFPCKVETEITRDGKDVFKNTMDCYEQQGTITADVFHKKALNGSFHFTGAYWSPEEPNLYDVVMTAEGRDGTKDQIGSYFGMRKIEIKDGKIYLNHRPYYQKLILDQGYWKESLVTAPSDQAFKEDIRKAKAMGFNGCRKHEKVEDPRFLYWADKMGFLVWEAMASFWVYTPQAASAFMKEWADVIQRDYNHPCIVVWGMLNESWGVPRISHDEQQQAYSKSLYYLARSLDTTRPVISNDGWEMTDTDICAFHSYKHGEEGDRKQQELFNRYLKSIEGIEKIMEKTLFAQGHSYKGQPVILSEFGGISVSEDEKGWGYTSVGKNQFLQVYDRILTDVYESEVICGFCYTQLADIEQEINGLLTENHEYKFDPEAIREIMERKK